MVHGTLLAKLLASLLTGILQYYILLSLKKDLKQLTSSNKEQSYELSKFCMLLIIMNDFK